MSLENMITIHRKSEITAQLLEETIRESRQLGDQAPLLLDKVKRAISQLEQNLCLHCGQEPDIDCGMCHGHYKID